MLTVKIKNRKEKLNPLFSDIEEVFHSTEIKDTKLVRKFISEIEHGEYLNNYHFKDRFGSELDYTYLSTGCKAALVLALGYTGTLDLTECGHNAIDSILKNCAQGSVILHDYYDFSWYNEDNSDDTCDIEFNGYRFTKISRFNYFLSYECIEGMVVPDFEIPGVESL